MVRTNERYLSQRGAMQDTRNRKLFPKVILQSNNANSYGLIRAAHSAGVCRELLGNERTQPNNCQASQEKLVIYILIPAALPPRARTPRKDVGNSFSRVK